MKLKESFGVLTVGDLVGKPGRLCFKKVFPNLKLQYKPDLVVINGENVAGGFGITEKIAKTFFEDHKIDVITTGNHWRDKEEVCLFGESYPRLLLPANMYNVSSYKRGYFVGKTKGGISYVVINLVGQVFMKGDNASAFITVDKILAEIPSYISLIFVDMHAEATSEKQALGHYLSERVSLVFGTHTHCQTSDECILSPKTAYITDVGMTGSFDSVIGMDKSLSIHNFISPKRKVLKPAQKDLQLCGLYAEFDLTSGACLKVERINKKVLEDS